MRDYVAAVGLLALAACNNSGGDVSTPTEPPTSQPQTGGVEISSSTYYVDPNFGGKGAVIWVVEVHNARSQGIESATIDVSTYDSAGSVLASDLGVVGPIPVGETRVHQGYADYSGKEATVRFQIGEVREGDTAGLSRAQVASSNWHSDPSFGGTGSVIWTVEVRNTSNTELESVEVEFSTYDAAGKILAADLTFVNAIPPGESRTGQGYANYHGGETTAKFQIADVR